MSLFKHLETARDTIAKLSKILPSVCRGQICIVKETLLYIMYNVQKPLLSQFDITWNDENLIFDG